MSLPCRHRGATVVGEAFGAIQANRTKTSGAGAYDGAMHDCCMLEGIRIGRVFVVQGETLEMGDTMVSGGGKRWKNEWLTILRFFYRRQARNRGNCGRRTGTYQRLHETKYCNVNGGFLLLHLHRPG